MVPVLAAAGRQAPILRVQSAEQWAGPTPSFPFVCGAVYSLGQHQVNKCTEPVPKLDLHKSVNVPHFLEWIPLCLIGALFLMHVTFQLSLSCLNINILLDCVVLLF